MADLPDKWKKSEKSLKAFQLAFEFNKGISDTIRQQASKQGLSTSDQIRSIIGLRPKKPLRPRLTVSLSAEDYQALSIRYSISSTDKNAIRKAIADDLIAFSEQQNINH
jgi:hypothetical protein